MKLICYALIACVIATLIFAASLAASLIGDHPASTYAIDPRTPTPITLLTPRYVVPGFDLDCPLMDVRVMPAGSMLRVTAVPRFANIFDASLCTAVYEMRFIYSSVIALALAIIVWKRLTKNCKPLPRHLHEPAPNAH